MDFNENLCLFWLRNRNHFPTTKNGQHVGTHICRNHYKTSAIICVPFVMPTAPRGARNGAARCPPPSRYNQPRIHPTGANRKPHTCAFTRIRPHLQNCGATDAQHAPALRRAVRASVWCHRPLRLMPPWPYLGWLPEPSPDGAPAVCFFMSSLT